MIWECTVCTNHFDGEAPPDVCHSCGSPRQYFTAYHYYGLQIPPADARMESVNAQRPSYTESSLEASVFRFHSANYFHSESTQFYRNFLETRRTFLEPFRFAGRGFNSGFYFATTEESAVAEKTFYSPDILLDTDSSPDVALSVLKAAGKPTVLLEVELAIGRVADLTDPVVLEHFLREGPTRARGAPSGVPYSILRAVVSPDPGGSVHTDGLGHYAASGGWHAIKFPSVRTLQIAWGIEHLTRQNLLAAVQPQARGLERSIEDQLRNQAIVVVFSGSVLARSIRRYTWRDADGRTQTAENPYWGTTAEELEATRVAYRDRMKLTPQEAAEQGFLTDDEIDDEYTPSWVMWVPKNENL